ncbi:hypothetical protein B0H19DRAFT_1073916 [Mycena capillaripes]|nr:hypothetical protein B0H19DRAFT_1073916 [Mycena capillaripes]
MFIFTSTFVATLFALALLGCAELIFSFCGQPALVNMDVRRGNTNQIWTSLAGRLIQWSSTNKCIDLTKSNTAPGTVLQIIACDTGLTQRILTQRWNHTSALSGTDGAIGSKALQFSKFSLRHDLLFPDLPWSSNEPILAEEPEMDEVEDEDGEIKGLGIWDSILADEPDEGEDDEYFA